MAKTAVKPVVEPVKGQKKIKAALEVAAKGNIPVLLVGETGCGKTSVVRELADKHGATFSRFNMTGETSVDEFVGKYTLKKGETVWQDGTLITAMKEGHWLVVDEINVALPEILLVMNSLLDDDRFITLANHDGEVIRCHENFRFFGTMNPSDEYAGTKELNKAFLSRFGMVLEMTYPPRHTEVSVVQRSGVTAKEAAQMVDVALKIREAKSEGKLYYTCSTRDLLHWGALVTDMDMQQAFEVAVMNKATNDAESIRECYKSVMRTWSQVEELEQELGGEEAVKRLKTLESRERDLKQREEHCEERVQMYEREREALKERERDIQNVVRREVKDALKGRLQDAIRYFEAA